MEPEKDPWIDPVDLIWGEEWSEPVVRNAVRAPHLVASQPLLPPAERKQSRPPEQRAAPAAED